MAIKRGVSSYCYQNLFFDKKMNHRSFIGEVREGLHTDGIEIIDEQIINGYPFLDEKFVFDWHNTMARYNMKAVTMDTFLDTMQFRDHVMNYAEAAERIKNSLRIASKLGFENVRALATTPIEVLEMALPTAEEVGVRLAVEIHAPLQLIPSSAAMNARGAYDGAIVDPGIAARICELKDKTGTDYLGIVPDMALFQYGIAPYVIEQVKEKVQNDDAVEMALSLRNTMPGDDIYKLVKEKFPNADLTALPAVYTTQGSSKIEELTQMVPYIVSVHGKFYDMIEDSKNPGHYVESTIDYKAVFDALKKGGYDGYVCSEFEGQVGFAGLGVDGNTAVDELEQVRRHHAMMQDNGAI